MPFTKVLRTENLELSKIAQHSALSTQHSKKGFTLVEILLSLFLILTIVSILFVTSGTFVSTRNSNLQGLATKIASREIENLRNTAFASLPASGAISDSDLSKLPSATATRTITDYQSSTKIKEVKIDVNWLENGISKKITLETLIAENGL